MVSANILNVIDFSKGVQFFCGVLICVFVVFYSALLWRSVRRFCGRNSSISERPLSLYVFGLGIAPQRAGKAPDAH